MEAFIEWILYLFLGILQGVTEPLPISSSGHLLIVRTLFDIGEMDVFFEVMVHFASFFAVLYLLRQKVIDLIKGSWGYVVRSSKTSKKEFDYVMLLLIATIPAGVAGIFLRNPLEQLLSDYSLLLVGLGLIVTAGLLWSTKFYKDSFKETINIKDGLFIGLFQAIAILPGISRSGSTIAGGLYRRINPKTLFEFTFLLYLPVTLGSGLLELLSIEEMSISWLNLGTSFIVSMVVTYFALKWFRGMVIEGRFKGFALYCFIVGITSIILFLV
jgi:undecaprenyl-diphosphatase